MCNAGASNAGRSLCVQISRERSYPVNILIQLERQLIALQICRGEFLYKSSAVAEMGDRGHNRHGPKKGGRCAPFAGAGTPPSTMWPAIEVYFRTKRRLHPSSHLARIHMGQKLGGDGCAPFSGGSWVHIEHNVA